MVRKNRRTKRRDHVDDDPQPNLGNFDKYHPEPFRKKDGTEVILKPTPPKPEPVRLVRRAPPSTLEELQERLKE